MTRYTSPRPLTTEHDRSGFSCGISTLDRWFRDRAEPNERAGASRTFVTCADDSPEVLGYYCLAASSVEPAWAPGAVRRNMPSPIPVVLLGRLAVDSRHHGLGLGAALLQDAILRVASAAHIIGVRALLVHAIDDNAAAFYRRFGFAPSPLDERTLFLRIDTIEATLQSEG